VSDSQLLDEEMLHTTSHVFLSPGTAGEPKVR